MKMSSNFFTGIVVLGCFSALGSCQDPETRFEDLPWSESAAEIEVLSDFILVGRTTRSEVIEELGKPSMTYDLDGGLTGLLYQWQTNPYVAEYFDPFSDGSVEDRTLETSQLYLDFDSHGVASKKRINGPR